MTSRFLIGLLALALLATGTFAGARSALAAARAASDAAILRAADGSAGAAAATAATPCKRGALAANACGSDHGLPAQGAVQGGSAGGVAFEVAAPPMSGVPPACLVGPPRRC